jgi:hypothetical protein
VVVSCGNPAFKDQLPIFRARVKANATSACAATKAREILAKVQTGQISKSVAKSEIESLITGVQAAYQACKTTPDPVNGPGSYCGEANVGQLQADLANVDALAVTGIAGGSGSGLLGSVSGSGSIILLAGLSLLLYSVFSE